LATVLGNVERISDADAVCLRAEGKTLVHELSRTVVLVSLARDLRQIHE
jgi:hypothetical protein